LGFAAVGAAVVPEGAVVVVVVLVGVDTGVPVWVGATDVVGEAVPQALKTSSMARSRIERTKKTVNLCFTLSSCILLMVV
jgi:hypothetical protein